MTRLVKYMIILVLFQVSASWFFAMFLPTEFGRWLQSIDNGRYEYTDCDCGPILD